MNSQDLAAKNSTSLFKLRNTIWNKIISNSEFDRFNESEYLKWQEIYRDAANVEKLNPVTIEQKLALIEVINAKTIMAGNNLSPSLKNDIEKLNALRLKKLSNHLQKMELNSKLTRDELENFSADLFLILKGPPISLLDYFTKNKSKAMNVRLFRTVQEDMLVMGLRGLMNRIPEKEAYTRMENSKYMINKFFQLKIWKYFVIPYDLPWFERLKIPEELLGKILHDGLQAHNEELVAHLKSQNMIDHYERFRKVYRPIAFAAGFAFYYQKFDEKFDETLKANQEEEKRKLLASFSTLADAVNSNFVPEDVSTEKLRHEQFSRLIENFRIEYGEEPTPEEYQELKAKIYNGKS